MSSTSKSFVLQDAPFAQQLELNDELMLPPSPGRPLKRSNSANPPTLPGQPSIQLSSSRLTEFLCDDLLTPDLNKMSPYLGLVATQSSDHVSALHAQGVRGRKIVITENPELHIVWIDDRVFVKPVPPYLLSWAFWQEFLVDNVSSNPVSSDRESVVRAALGYMRTYKHLIKHESDFRIARESHLLPESVQDWPQWVAFIECFAAIPDSSVSGRYHYGELRLTRLNVWAKVFLQRWVFHKADWQYSAYFARLYGPILFIFAVFSVVLSAMQVELAAETTTVQGSFTVFQRVSKWFSIVIVIFASFMALLLMSLFFILSTREIVFAVKTRRKVSVGNNA